MNVATMVLALKGWERSQHCAYLVSLSTTTIIKLFPSDWGRLVIKYIDTSSQCWHGMLSGCKRPGVLTISTLFCWKTKHSTINLRTSYLRPSQKKCFLTLWCVFRNHEFPPIGEVCNSKRTFCLICDFLDIYISDPCTIVNHFSTKNYLMIWDPFVSFEWASTLLGYYSILPFLLPPSQGI